LICSCQRSERENLILGVFKIRNILLFNWNWGASCYNQTRESNRAYLSQTDRVKYKESGFHVQIPRIWYIRMRFEWSQSRSWIIYWVIACSYVELSWIRLRLTCVKWCRRRPCGRSHYAYIKLLVLYEAKDPRRASCQSRDQNIIIYRFLLSLSNCTKRIFRFVQWIVDIQYIATCIARLQGKVYLAACVCSLHMLYLWLRTWRLRTRAHWKQKQGALEEQEQASTWSDTRSIPSARTFFVSFLTGDEGGSVEVVSACVQFKRMCVKDCFFYFSQVQPHTFFFRLSPPWKRGLVLF